MLGMPWTTRVIRVTRVTRVTRVVRVIRTTRVTRVARVIRVIRTTRAPPPGTCVPRAFGGGRTGPMSTAAATICRDVAGDARAVCNV